MPPKSPVFVLVHGYGHGSWVWNPLTSALATSGLRAISVDLPSTHHPDTPCNSTAPQADIIPDVQTVCAAIDALLDAGEDVVVVAHSYAGVVVGEAVGTLLETVAKPEDDKKHHGLAERILGEKKSRGRVRWLVYLAAYPVPKDKALWNAGDGLQEAEETKGLVYVDIKDGWATPNAKAPATYMGDLPEAEQAQWATRLGKFSLGPAMSTLTAVPGWVRIPSTFVRPAQDVPFPAQFQDRLIERAREHALQIQTAEGDENRLVPFTGAGVEDEEELGVARVDAAHNVMLSKTEWVRDLLVKVVARLEQEH